MKGGGAGVRPSRHSKSATGAAAPSPSPSPVPPSQSPSSPPVERITWIASLNVSSEAECREVRAAVLDYINDKDDGGGGTGNEDDEDEYEDDGGVDAFLRGAVDQEDKDDDDEDDGGDEDFGATITPKDPRVGGGMNGTNGANGSGGGGGGGVSGWYPGWESDIFCTVFFSCGANTVSEVYAKFNKLGAVITNVEKDTSVETQVMASSLSSPASSLSSSAAPLSWGLDRIDQEFLPLSQSALEVSHNGTGVNVYVIDTGINKDHLDFTGRARFGKTMVTGEGKGDNNGHGSHCAGTVGGAEFGVAKGATVWGVKALTKSGSGATSNVISSINWVVRNQAVNFNGESAVISLSLGGGRSTVMNQAASAAAAAGMIVVVAAGNENADACSFSPAGAGGNAAQGGVVSVASTTRGDSKSGFSNWGKCVDLFAPGSQITSVWIGSDTAVNTISGTSMAAPHVAGVAATLLEKHGKDKNAAQTELISLLVSNRVTGIAEEDTPNLLLQTPRHTGPPTPPTLSPTIPPTNLPELVCMEAECTGFEAATYGPRVPDDFLLVAPLAVATSTPYLCERTNEDFTGKIVLVVRGNCIFFDKTKNAERQGAEAVIIMPADPADRVFPPSYYGADTTRIPTVMINHLFGVLYSTQEGQEISIGSPSLLVPAGTPMPSPSPSPSPSQPTQKPTKGCVNYTRKKFCLRDERCKWDREDAACNKPYCNPRAR